MDSTEEAAVSGEEEATLDVGGTIVEAFTTVGEGLVGVISSFDLLGLGLIGEDSDAIADEIGAEASVYQQIAANFTVFSAFAYLLFVLMYFPSLAVVGAARQEMGGFYAGLMVIYSTLLAWSVAALFYQIAEGHNMLYILISLFVLGFIYGALYVIGLRERKEPQVVFAPPMRKSCC